MFLRQGILTVSTAGILEIRPMDDYALSVEAFGDTISYRRLLAVSLQVKRNERRRASGKRICERFKIDINSKPSRNRKLLKVIKVLSREQYQGEMFLADLCRMTGLTISAASRYVKRLQGFIDITHQKSRKANKLEFHTGLLEPEDRYLKYLMQCVRGLEKYEAYFFSDAVKSNNMYSKTYPDFQNWMKRFREQYIKIGEFVDTVTTTTEFVYEERYIKYEKQNKVTGRNQETRKILSKQESPKHKELAFRNTLYITIEQVYHGFLRPMGTGYLSNGKWKSINYRLNAA